MKSILKYILNLLISIDQLANTILLGSPDETISSRIGKMAYVYNVKSKPILWLVKILNKIDPDHCKKSIEWDEGKNNIQW